VGRERMRVINGARTGKCLTVGLKKKEKKEEKEEKEEERKIVRRPIYIW
jgi:hypothetical protein